MYQNSGTNYYGNSYNNFLINTGNFGIITKSLHSSPNYSNTYNINYNSYPSPFRGSSGTYNEEFLMATYNVQPSNKIKLNFYFKYGTWFNGNNQNSFEGFYTFKVTTFYVKVYEAICHDYTTYDKKS